MATDRYGAESSSIAQARLTRRETLQEVQRRIVSERLAPMLEDLGEAMAARFRMDARPAAPNIKDVDALITFVEVDWPPLERLLAAIPREKWPPGAAEVAEAVADITQTLHRPF